jgi:hypothetical protein
MISFLTRFFGGRNNAHSGGAEMTRVPTVSAEEEEEEGVPSATEISITEEACDVGVFHDGNLQEVGCFRDSPFCRRLSNTAVSTGMKTRFVFVSSIVGGISGIIAYTLATNTFYVMGATGCEGSPAFYNMNLTADSWRISPYYGVCPESGRTTSCLYVDGTETECYTSVLNCMSFANSTVWANFDEKNALNGYTSHLEEESQMWIDNISTLSTAALCTVLLGVAAMLGDIVCSKLVLTPIWNCLRAVIRTVVFPNAPTANPLRGGRGGEPERAIAPHRNEDDGWENYSHLIEEEGAAAAAAAAAAATATAAAAPATAAASSVTADDNAAVGDSATPAQSVQEITTTSTRGVIVTSSTTPRGLMRTTTAATAATASECDDAPDDAEAFASNNEYIGSSTTPRVLAPALMSPYDRDSVHTAAETRGDVEGGGAVGGVNDEREQEQQLAAKGASSSEGREGGAAVVSIQDQQQLQLHPPVILAEAVESDQESDDVDEEGRFNFGMGGISSRRRGSSFGSDASISPRRRSRSRSYSWDGASVSSPSKKGMKKRPPHEIPTAVGARSVQVAQAEGLGPVENSRILRLLDSDFEELVGKEWPFFKAICLLQLVSFSMVVQTYNELIRSEVLEPESWSHYYLDTCKTLTFQKHDDVEFFVFVEVVTGVVFCVMFLHVASRLQQLLYGECVV